MWVWFGCLGQVYEFGLGGGRSAIVLKGRFRARPQPASGGGGLGLVPPPPVTNNCQILFTHR